MLQHKSGQPLLREVRKYIITADKNRGTGGDCV